jgi:hypothetical protein
MLAERSPPPMMKSLPEAAAWRSGAKHNSRYGSKAQSLFMTILRVSIPLTSIAFLGK